MAAIQDDITIGQLTKRIRIEKQIKSDDSHGTNNAKAYQIRAVVWASIEPLSEREALQAASVTSALRSAITIWYRGDISITDRILLGSRTFQIESYQDPTGQQVQLRLVCVERQS